AFEGLRRGEGVVLVVESPHLDAIRRNLNDRGVDLGAGPTPGVCLLEAGAVLDEVMVDGRPAADRFAAVIGAAVQSALQGRTRARVYGEMVDKLWREGDIPGALALEVLWNELVRELPFTLYCAYHETLLGGAPEEEDLDALDATCRLHSSVVAEGVLAPRTSASRSFAAKDTAPAAARAFLLGTQENPAARLAEAAALVVSELATNAVRHGGTRFSVTVSSLAQAVRIAVGDSCQEPPVMRNHSETGATGRGLRIVDALCRDWGTTPRYCGKVVWAELDR
ncbi:MAG: MEDS domain-containing protein, partial [Acidimicrobiales bacterium]